MNSRIQNNLIFSGAETLACDREVAEIVSGTTNDTEASIAVSFDRSSSTFYPPKFPIFEPYIAKYLVLLFDHTFVYVQTWLNQ